MTPLAEALSDPTSPQFKKLAERLATKKADVGPFGAPQAGRINREATPHDPALSAGQREAKPIPEALKPRVTTPDHETVKTASAEAVVGMLNKALASELCAIAMYITYSAKIVGPYRPALAKFLFNEVEDETGHAKFLANKIVAMSDEPATVPALVKQANSNETMLHAVLEAEIEAIGIYTSILEALEGFEDQALRVDIENILTDERRHYEEVLKIVAGFGKDPAVYA